MKNNRRGNANKIKNSTVFRGVGGRGLCAGTTQNNAGKTALELLQINHIEWGS
jgi:hypothetical protein